MKTKLKPQLIFNLLVGFIFAIFIWWMFFFVRIVTETHLEKRELTILNNSFQKDSGNDLKNAATILAIDREYKRYLRMIISEGVFFLIVLSVVTYMMNQSLLREYKVNRQQKNFLLSITHELRSPIASSKVALQTMLKRELLPREKVEILINNSLHDMERLQGLVENILLAAKIEDHTFHIGSDACDLSEIVQAAVDKAKITSGLKHSFQTNIEPEVMVVGDQMALNSVVTNLLENAIKYSADATLIQVSVSEEKNHVVFAVADNGFGIPDLEKKKVFQKFYRIGQEETRKTKGTGLGLYIVGRILELHRGKVTVKDNQPIGSIFEVELPKLI